MRLAGHDLGRMRRRLGGQRTDDVEHGVADHPHRVAQPHPEQRGYLIVSRPARPQAPTEVVTGTVDQATLERAVQASPVTVLRAEAGWSSVLRLPAVKSEEELVLGLLRDAGVLVQPGWYYDFESEPYAVVSLLTEPRAFAEGAARLVEYVNRAAS
jgi:aspartate/methionine/tyrosine aminotransferase